MAEKQMTVKVLQVVKTTEQWATAPVSETVLSTGLLGFETATNGEVYAKIGDGTHTWSALPYVTDPTVASKVETLQVAKVKGVITQEELEEKTTGNHVGDVWIVGTSDPENPTADDYQEYIWVEETHEVEDPLNPGETIEETVGKWEAIGTINTPYELPIASAETLGGIKVGTGLNIASATGVLSVPVMTGATPLIPAVEPDPEVDDDEGTPAVPAAAGTAGLVPAPQIGDETKVLSGAGTWVTMVDSALEQRVAAIEEDYITTEDELILQCTL